MSHLVARNFEDLAFPLPDQLDFVFSQSLLSAALAGHCRKQILKHEAVLNLDRFLQGIDQLLPSINFNSCLEPFRGYPRGGSQASNGGVTHEMTPALTRKNVTEVAVKASYTRKSLNSLGIEVMETAVVGLF